MKEFFVNIIQDHGEHFIRLLFACFCGAIIGLERSVKRKGAGIKTHIILALGAALFMMVSHFGFGDLNLTPEYRADASRIASNIVTGVSFLCAGVIFVRGASVKGLTTATGIWTTAGIGMAAGAGMYAVAVAATLLTLIGLEAFGYIFKKLAARRIYISILVDNKQMAQTVYLDLKKVGYQILSYEMNKLDNAEGYRVAIVVRSLVGNDEKGFIEVLHTNPDITVEQVE